MTVQKFSRAQLHASPWKNGGGVTREIAAIPHGADLERFVWRASIAELSASGAFSLFPGVSRVLVLLEGAGAVLLSPDGDVVHRLDTPLEPFAFAGDTPLIASLLNGASSDFNVMTRRSDASADVQVVRASSTQPSAPAGVLLAVRGRWLASAINKHELENADVSHTALGPGDGLWWDGKSVAWRLDRDPNEDSTAVLLAVHICPAVGGDNGAELHRPSVQPR